MKQYQFITIFCLMSSILYSIVVQGGVVARYFAIFASITACMSVMQGEGRAK